MLCIEQLHEKWDILYDWLLYNMPVLQYNEHTLLYNVLLWVISIISACVEGDWYKGETTRLLKVIKVFRNTAVCIRRY